MAPSISNPEKQPLLPTTKSVSENHQATFSPNSRVAIEEDERDNIRGYIYMGLSTIGFAGMAILVRAAESNYDIPALTSIFVRGVVHTTLALIGISMTRGLRNEFGNMDARTGLLLLLRGIAGTCALIFLFLGLQILPVGECQTIYFSNPVMVMILSYIFLGEPITRVDVIAAMTGIIGIIIVAQPYTEHDTIPASTRIVGSLLAFGAAVLGAIAYTTIRTLSVNVHFFTNVFAFAAVSFLQTALFGGAIGLDFIQSNRTGTLLVFIAALFAFMGQTFLTKGLQHCRAGPGVLIRNLDVPVVYLLGLVFLGEIPSFIRLLGSAIVLGSVIAIGVNRLLRS